MKEIIIKRDFNLFLTNFFISLFLFVLALRCCPGFSLVAVHGLLTAVSSLVADHGL